MPIYAYKCSACGFAKDALQKMSDAPLTVCPACGETTFSKQLTAAGFQLKGSGWYVTDFREGGGKKGGDKPAEKSAESADGASAKPADGASGTTPAASPSAAPAAAPTAAAASAPSTSTKSD